MMPTRLLLTGAIALTLLLAGARTARADCCNDFWSCAAAVATLGGSCVVDAITSAAAEAALRPTINQLTQTIQNGRDNLAKAMSDREKLADDSAAQVGTELHDSRTQAANAKDRADVALSTATAGRAVAIAPPGALATGASTAPNRGAAPGSTASAAQSSRNVPTGAVGSTDARAVNPTASTPTALINPLADPARMKRAMEFAHGKVGEDQTGIVKLADQFEPKLPAVQKQARQGTQELKPLYDKDVAGPLQNLVDRMFAFIKNPTSPIALANLISAVGGEITMIVNNNIARFNARDQALANELGAKLNELNDGSGAAQSKVAHAETITALMEKVAKEPRVYAVQKLEQAAGVPHKAARLRPLPAMHMALAASSTSGLSRVASDLQRASAIAMAPKGPGSHTASLSAYKGRVNSELDRRLAGKTGTAAKTEFDALRGEASKRFAGDPATRDAVLRYLDNEARRYQTDIDSGRHQTHTPALPAVQKQPGPNGATK